MFGWVSLEIAGSEACLHAAARESMMLVAATTASAALAPTPSAVRCLSPTVPRAFAPQLKLTSPTVEFDDFAGVPRAGWRAAAVSWGTRDAG